MFGEFLPEALRLRQHPNQPPLNRLGCTSDQFRTGRDFPARSFAALLNAERRSGSSMRSCCAIRVAHSERKIPFGIFCMYGKRKLSALCFPSPVVKSICRAAQSGSPRKGRFLQQLEVFVFPAFADE